MSARNQLVVTFFFCLVLGFCTQNSVAKPKVLKADSSNVVQKDEIVADITFKNTLQALERIVFYYFKHRKQATVDFAFGLRAAEGEITRILQMGRSGAYPDMNTESRLKLEGLLQSIQVNVKQSIPFIKSEFEEYFQKFFFLIKQKWLPYQMKPQYTVQDDISIFPNVTEDETEGLDEDSSDFCMLTLTGNEKIKKCSINHCWKKMTVPGKFHYYITHQILWLLLGEKSGCKKDMDKRAIRDGYKHGIDDVIKRLCAGIVVEMESISESGIKKGMMDLFLEQGFVCGSIGFVDAVRPQWLRSVLSFQNPPTGCFLEAFSTEDDFHEYRFWINYKREVWKSRNLLAETVLEDGCSTHATGLAAAFLATYLRLFFDPFYKKNQYDPYVVAPVREDQPLSSPLFSIKVLWFSVIFILILVLLKYRIVQKVYVKMYFNCFARCRRPTIKPFW